MRHVQSVTVAAAVVLAGLSPAFALQKSPAAAPSAQAAPLKACSLVARSDVKKLLPWPPHVDQMPEEEEPVGAGGSSCNYPSVTIQVLSASQGILEAAKKQYKLETVSGVGEEAYFRNNKNLYAEVISFLRCDVPMPDGKGAGIDRQNLCAGNWEGAAVRDCHRPYSLE